MAQRNEAATMYKGRKSARKRQWPAQTRATIGEQCLTTVCLSVFCCLDSLNLTMVNFCFLSLVIMIINNGLTNLYAT